jgi:hypothetical protein
VGNKHPRGVLIKDFHQVLTKNVDRLGGGVEKNFPDSMFSFCLMNSYSHLGSIHNLCGEGL